MKGLKHNSMRLLITSLADLRSVNIFSFKILKLIVRINTLMDFKSHFTEDNVQLHLLLMALDNIEL